MKSFSKYLKYLGNKFIFWYFNRIARKLRWLLGTFLLIYLFFGLVFWGVLYAVVSSTNVDTNQNIAHSNNDNSSEEYHEEYKDFWYSYWLLFDPGALERVEHKDTLPLQFIPVFFAFIGLVLTAFLIATVVNYLGPKTEAIKSGRLKVPLKKFILIAGWNSKTLKLIEELVRAEMGRLPIVVLSEADKSFMDSEIRDALKYIHFRRFKILDRVHKILPEQIETKEECNTNFTGLRGVVRRFFYQNAEIYVYTLNGKLTDKDSWQYVNPFEAEDILIMAKESTVMNVLETDLILNLLELNHNANLRENASKNINIIDYVDDYNFIAMLNSTLGYYEKENKTSESRAVIYRDLNQSETKTLQKHKHITINQSLLFSKVVTFSILFEGYTSAIKELFSFKGNQIYINTISGAEQYTFSELISHYHDAIPIGLFRKEHNKDKYKFYFAGESNTTDKKLLEINKTDEIVYVSKKKVKSTNPPKNESDSVVNIENNNIKVTTYNTKTKNIFIVGTNPMLIHLIQNILHGSVDRVNGAQNTPDNLSTHKQGRYITKESVIYIDSRYYEKHKTDLFEHHESIRPLEEGVSTNINLLKQTINSINSDSKSSLTNVVILNEWDKYSIEEADDRALMNLSLVSSVRNNSYPSFSIIVEIIQNHKADLAKSLHPDDVINTGTLTSMLMAQMSHEIRFGKLANELLEQYGAEIFVLSPDDLDLIFEDFNGLSVKNLRDFFYNKYGYILLGWKLSSGELILNPKTDEILILKPETNEKVILDPKTDENENNIKKISSFIFVGRYFPE